MRKFKTIPFVLSFFLVLFSCIKVPLTNRRQVNILPNSQINSMSFDSYREFMSMHRLSSNAAETDKVRKVGERVKNAVEEFMKKKKLSKKLKGYKWEFNLVEEAAINAWCMPGGKVVVYTGILPLTLDEPGLAVVMGHEIAHAIANHGNERLSQSLLTQMGGVALAIAIRDKPQETQLLYNVAFGLGTTVGVMLPFSRLHEAEADRMGLVFMAMAGYDPHKAVEFWERMEKSESTKIPEFISTHPSHKTRIENLKKCMPEALANYKGQ